MQSIHSCAGGEVSVCVCVCEVFSVVSMSIPYCRGCVPEEDMTEFLNDGSWKRGINANRLFIFYACCWVSDILYLFPFSCRQYYHTQSCTPMFPDELQFDSDNDEIPEWQKICSQKVRQTELLHCRFHCFNALWLYSDAG